jgi:hypothetical protein
MDDTILEKIVRIISDRIRYKKQMDKELRRTEGSR